MLHDFDAALALSHQYAAAPWWEAVYRSSFPDFVGMVDMRQDGQAQRRGVDRVVYCRRDKSFRIDEKVRAKDYGDILLEYWSDHARRKPGWVAKDLACDFIAYAVVPAEVCYLLPFEPLRRAWRLHRKRWVAHCRRVEAQNDGYVTVSVAVPVDTLLSALTAAMRTSWKA